MRGLIYKNIKLSMKAPKINLLFGIFAIGISVIGISPVIGALFFSFVISSVSTYCFYLEYKCGWNRYGNILPLKKWKNIASKYLSCLIFVIISVLGGSACNILYAVVTHTYSLDIIVLSLCVSVVFPLLWASVFLPSVFKFGIQSASYFRLLLIPALYLLRNFMENDVILSNALLIPVLILLCLVILGISFLISVFITGKRL